LTIVACASVHVGEDCGLPNVLSLPMAHRCDHQREHRANPSTEWIDPGYNHREKGGQACRAAFAATGELSPLFRGGPCSNATLGVQLLR